MNDDDLRARLRAADPARHLTDSRHLDLTEADMSTNPIGPSTGPRSSRARIALAVAAAAVVVLAGVGVVIANNDDEGPAPEARPSEGASQSTAPTRATYTLEAGPAARCIPPNEAGIATLDTAFHGTVVSVDDTEIVVEPTTFYTGEQVDQVVVQVRKGVNRELLPVDFKKGADYVIAVKGGVIQLCGYTAEATVELQKRYAESLAD